MANHAMSATQSSRGWQSAPVARNSLQGGQCLPPRVERFHEPTMMRSWPCSSLVGHTQVPTHSHNPRSALWPAGLGSLSLALGPLCHPTVRGVETGRKPQSLELGLDYLTLQPHTAVGHQATGCVPKRSGRGDESTEETSGRLS